MRFLLPVLLMIAACDDGKQGTTGVQSVKAVPLRTGQETADCAEVENNAPAADTILHAPEGALSLQVFSCYTNEDGGDECEPYAWWRTSGREVIVSDCKSTASAPRTVEVRWIAL